MAGLLARRAAQKAATKATATQPLGKGTRFKAVQKSVAAGLKPSSIRAGQTRQQAAGAIAAAAGRKKFGAKRMGQLSALGKK